MSSKFSFKNSSTLKYNHFIGTNLKSLAVHKRKCKGIKINNDEKIDEDNNDTDIIEQSDETKLTTPDEKDTKKHQTNLKIKKKDIQV